MTFRFRIFYGNRNDHSLIATKRCEGGRALSYGHLMAWVWTLGAPIAIGVAVYLGKR